jgi:predicted DNA-binding ribbon-helix-helix protein
VFFTRRGPSLRWGDALLTPPVRFSGPVKRSIMIAGHSTSISLESVFWDALKAEAEAEGVPVSALVARIDSARIEGRDPPNLGSAIRTWLFLKAKSGESSL